MFFGCLPCCGGIGCGGLCLSTNYHPVTGASFSGTTPTSDALGNTYGSLVSSVDDCSVLLHREASTNATWSGIPFASEVGPWVASGGVAVLIVDTCFFTPGSSSRSGLHATLSSLGSSMRLKDGDIFTGRVGSDSIQPAISSAHGLVNGLSFSHACAYGITGGTSLVETDAFILSQLAAQGRQQGVIMAYESIGSGYVVLCSDDDINGGTSTIPPGALSEMLCRLTQQQPADLFSIA